MEHIGICPRCGDELRYKCSFNGNLSMWDFDGTYHRKTCKNPRLCDIRKYKLTNK